MTARVLHTVDEWIDVLLAQEAATEAMLVSHGATEAELEAMRREFVAAVLEMVLNLAQLAST